MANPDYRQRSSDIDESNSKSRQMSPTDLEEQLAQARGERDEWRQGNPRPTSGAGQNDWDNQYHQLNGKVVLAADRFDKSLQNASPEELTAVSNKIDQRMEALNETMEKQRPGQAASQKDQDNQQGQQADDQAELRVQAMSAPNLEDRLSARRNQGQEEEGAAVGRRLQPNFGAYATTVEEEDNFKQQEENRLAAQRELGRAPTHDEVLKYESNLAEQALQEAPRQQAPAQASQASADQDEARTQDQGATQAASSEQDLHTQTAQITSSPMADRLAARRQQQTEGNEASNGEQSERQSGQEVSGSREDQKAHNADKVAVQETKAEAAAEQTPVFTRDWGEEDGMQM